MTHIIRLLALTLCSILLGACSNDQTDKAGMFQEQVKTLDKARTVEDTLLKANQQQREMIDAQSK